MAFPAIVATAAVGLFKKSSTGASNADTDNAYNAILAHGDQGSIDSLVARAGYAGGAGMAVGKGAKAYAQGKLWALVSQGILLQPKVRLNSDAGVSEFGGLPYDTPNLTGQYRLAPTFKPSGVLGAPVEAAQSPLDQALAPLRAAGTQAEADAREALAQSIERSGVGGAAALAQKVRGQAGPLDTAIEFAKKPAGTLVVVAGVLLVVVLVARAAR